MDKIYQTVILAGLLHDVGKFLQRSEFKGTLRVTGKHPAISGSFVKARAGVFEKVSDVNLLTELVQRHHETPNFPPELRVQMADPTVRPLAYLVSAADNYSSAERGEEAGEYRDYKTVPLACVFSRLFLTRPTPSMPNYKLHSLNPANAFPSFFNELDPMQMNKYLESFGRDFDKMASCINLADFDCLYTHLLSLLQRYTWCVPSNTQEKVPDISLYDHIRTTSAIAACLYRYHKESGNMNEKDIADSRPDKFRMVLGDLSGIQNYIFDIANTGVGGVAKRLRARSFYLNALVDAVSHNLIHSFNLPITNIVISSGGKFYVLLPNLPGSGGIIEEFQQDLDRWSVKHFGGELVVNLAQMEFNGRSFNNFGHIIDELSEILNKRKSAPLKSILVKERVWSTELFHISIPKNKEGLCLCNSCNKQIAVYISDNGDRLCVQCRRDLKLGAILPHANYIAFSKADFPSKDKPVFPLYSNYSFTVLDDVPGEDFPAYLVYRFNDTKADEVNSHPVLPKFIANHVPLAEDNNCEGCSGCKDEIKPTTGKLLYFDCLSNKSRGRKLLGYLKADVDNLGSLFICGLRDDKTDRNSISRIATMSRMLDLFFSGRVEQLLNNYFSLCYTVFSGGDDLLIVGPWNEIVNLTVTMQNEFRNFTGNNENVTISAGISLLKPGVPVSRSVAAADEALEASKEKILKGESEGRDQLTFLERTIKWSKVPSLIQTANQLAGWLRTEKLTVGFLRKLLLFAEMHQQYYSHNKVRGLRYLPLLNYTIARNLAPLDTRDKEALDIRIWAESLKKLNHDHTVYLDFLVKYALLTKE